MAVKVSSKYQVVIPESVREQLGLRPGTQVDVIAKGGVAYLVPIPSLDRLKEDLQGKISHKGLRDKRERKI